MAEMTRWGENVYRDEAPAWQEYPRPQMQREDWQCLNGMWDYAVSGRETETMPEAEGKIRVPFCIESVLSGVERPLQPEEKLWYRRTFSLPQEWEGSRILLHFGAVDWQARVFVNGTKVTEHCGGYTPFSADITDTLQPGDNELVVAVTDPTDAKGQPRGKQSLDPQVIFYTAVSGIWQTVWMEPVPARYITGVEIIPDLKNEGIDLQVKVSDDTHVPVSVEICDEEGEVLLCQECLSMENVFCHIPQMHPWTPETPYLYTLRAYFTGEEDNEDCVICYFAMRTVGISQDGDEAPRITLNGEPYFQIGLLDQGYWPDGLYTPPSEEAMEEELRAVKELGFHMLRKHVKVEPARWYYLCDRLGILVWQDMVSGGKPLASLEQMMELGKNMALDLGTRDDEEESYRLIVRDAADRENFERELREMIEALKGFPCICVWVLFNESWGQFDSTRLTEVIRALDPTRPVDANSGWIDQGNGDIRSYHTYAPTLALPPEADSRDENCACGKKGDGTGDRGTGGEKADGRAWAISECGGFTYTVPGHEWKKEEFGYTRSGSLEEYRIAYRTFMDQEVPKIRDHGGSAVIYTQLTDVEGEMNGLFTYDRTFRKVEDTL